LHRFLVTLSNPSYRYNPGDVAVIHPEASSIEVESFLVSMGWVNSADVKYSVEHTMLGGFQIVIYCTL
jgi:sulfite reductase alpha subunit-like flavoprotein